MKAVILFLILLALPVMAAYGDGDYGNGTYNGTIESTPAPSQPSSGGGASGGVGFGNFSPPKKIAVVVNNTVTASNQSSSNQTIIIENNNSQVVKEIKIETPIISVQINLNVSKVLDNVGVWAGETSEHVQRYIMEGGAAETLNTYILQATDLPNYSFRAKILLIFTIVSLVFIIIKPRDGREHPVHHVMKRIMFGHKGQSKPKASHQEIKAPIHHRIKHHISAIAAKVTEKKPIAKKFVGKIRFANGKSEYCYESEGKAVVCHGNMAQLASELKKKFGRNFKGKMTYEAPHKKLNNAKFVELASIEQHNLEKLIDKPIHHKVVHHAKHVVHRVHHTAKHVVHHVAKHAAKVKPVVRQVTKHVAKQETKPKPKPRKKHDKYLDFYKKVKNAKSLKEISES